MEGAREFLESSTIHGLIYISTAQNLSKLFWICTVICGFLTAGLLINNAFLDWAEHPIETTIKFYSISDIKFPSIVVCPPKVHYCSLIIYIKKDTIKLRQKVPHARLTLCQHMCGASLAVW